MCDYKVYYFKQTESIFMEKVPKQEATDGLIDAKTIEPTRSSSVNDISSVNSEKRLPVISVSDTQASKSKNGIEQETGQKHNKLGISPINPQGINASQTNYIDAYQYIAELQEQLQLAQQNNKILTDNLKDERYKVCSLEEELIVEKTEKEREKGKRLELEDQLRQEKEARENEIKVRRKQKYEYGLLLGKNKELEKKCQALEMTVQSNEEKSKIEIALVKKELLVVERERERSELELKDVCMELGCLKKMIGERDRKMGDMGQEIKELKEVKDEFDSRIEKYKQERDADLGELNGILLQLKDMRKPLLQRFRRRPTKTHEMIDLCITEVNKRIGCYP